MTELRAEWRRTTNFLSHRISLLECDDPAASEADPDVAAALWLLKLKDFREQVEELLLAYPGD